MHLKNLVFLITCLVFFLDCEKQAAPSINQEKLIDILVDVHLVEASLLGFSDEQKDSLSNIYYHQIYEIHAISEDRFLTEMNYLKMHPDYMIDTYEKVLEEIAKRENELK